MVSKASIDSGEAITVAEVLMALFLGRGGLVCHFALALNSVLLLRLRPKVQEEVQNQGESIQKVG